MERQNEGIIQHNLRVFYVVDTFRALWFITSIWVLFERQFLTFSQLTFIESLLMGMNLLMQLPTGAFADLFGKRKAMMIGGFLFALGLMIYSRATTFSMFVLYAIIFGTAEAFIDGTREALIYDTLREEHKEEQFPFITSKLSMIFQIALSVATLVGGFIGSFSYVYVIWMTAASFIGVTLVSFFFREPHMDTETFTIANYIHKTKQGMKELVKNSHIKKISLFYVLIGSVSWICVFSLNMILLTSASFSSKEIGIAISLGRIFNSFILFGLISKTKFFNKTRTFIVLPIVLAVGLIPILLLPKWFILLPIIITLFISNARWNILGRYTNAEFESRNRATAISALAMVVNLLYVLVMSVAGIVIEQFGGPRIIYTSLGFITLFITLPLGIHLAKIHKNEK